MSPKILSGTEVREHRLVELKNRFAGISPTPELAIIQVGDRPDSTAYINGKIAFGKQVGVITHHIHLPESATQDEILTEVKKCNENRSIKGIIVQLPLPEHIDRHQVINTIDSAKDIDGLTEVNVNLLNENNPKAVVPATARGVMELLKYYGVDLMGKKVTVVGRSALVGKPIAQLLSNSGAIVTVAHSKTVDLVKETISANIIIVAVGKLGLITREHVRPGQVIVDVGINTVQGEKLDEEVPRRKLVGDIDFDEVSKIIGPDGAISPVPGGVGPMTILSLFENLADVSR
jgi:methylenetetrahydrofolate dehydrogenase (NADP+)/methenyltetrahydrofolate cyclohydrolase